MLRDQGCQEQVLKVPRPALLLPRVPAQGLAAAPVKVPGDGGGRRRCRQEEGGIEGQGGQDTGHIGVREKSSKLQST